MNWLLDQSVLYAMQNAAPLSAAQIAQATAAIGDPRGNAERVMTVAGGAATINIVGVMTSQPSFMAFFFGGGNTLFGDIVAAVRSAESDPAIKSVDFAFSSGGGEALPTAAVGDVIADMKKPTRAIVSTAASAAFWLASQADKIVASGRASQVGSIGVVMTLEKPSESNFIEVTSTNAPDKRPNPETEEGRAVIRAQIDPIHDLFATAVAIGRDTTVEKVNNDFGRGGMMLAEQALAVGMIDEIATASKHNDDEQIKRKTTNQATGATTMDLAELKASHPALYAQVLADGHKTGAAAELDRVKFHATMGKKTGATDIALVACINGTAKDDGETMAEYLTASANNADLAGRTADELALKGNNPAPQDENVREKTAIASIFSNIIDEEA